MVSRGHLCFFLGFIGLLVHHIDLLGVLVRMVERELALTTKTARNWLLSMLVLLLLLSTCAPAKMVRGWVVVGSRRERVKHVMTCLHIGHHVWQVLVAKSCKPIVVQCEVVCDIPRTPIINHLRQVVPRVADKGCVGCLHLIQSEFLEVKEGNLLTGRRVMGSCQTASILMPCSHSLVRLAQVSLTLNLLL